MFFVHPPEKKSPLRTAFHHKALPNCFLIPNIATIMTNTNFPLNKICWENWHHYFITFPPSTEFLFYRFPPHQKTHNWHCFRVFLISQTAKQVAARRKKKKRKRTYSVVIIQMCSDEGSEWSESFRKHAWALHEKIKGKRMGDGTKKTVNNDTNNHFLWQ